MHGYSEDFSSQKVLADLFKRYIGHGKLLTAESVAQDCGCSVEGVYAARRGQVGVNLAVKILRLLPPEANAEFMRRCLGYVGAHPIVPHEGCFRKLHSAGAKLVHVLAHMFEDGRIDATEERELRRDHLPQVEAELTRVMGVR